ncbi:MAG: cytochrome c biogenesis protein CcsA [Gammaproteobacteria bacterium]
MHEMLLPGVTSLLYLILAALAGRAVMGSAPQSSPGATAQTITALTLLLHGTQTYNYLNNPAGIDLSFSNTLSLTALVTVAIFWVSSWRTHLDGFGIIVMPLAAICSLLPILPLGNAQPITMSGPLLSHILLSIVAYSLLAVASLQALFMAFIDHQLRSKHPGTLLTGMPPLQQLETLLFRFILVGFIALSASLVSGWLYMDDLFGQHVIHKTVLSILAWVTYTLLLAGHYLLGWRGRTAVRLCLAAFSLLVIGYIGSKFVLEIILQR